MINFSCKYHLQNSQRTWKGAISKLIYWGNHLEVTVQMSTPITAVICKTLSGYFVYFMSFETGVNASSIFDVDEVSGRLQSIFKEKDAVTIAFAIKHIGHLLSSPHSRRKTRQAIVGELPF